MLSSEDRRGFLRGEPRLDFRQVPDDTPRGQSEPPWEIAALLHLVDCRIRQGYELTKFMSPDRTWKSVGRPVGHGDLPR